MGAVAILIAVSLLSVCGLSFSHVSLQCQKGLLHDQDLEEKKLTFKARYDAVDESHCQHICTQHPECHFFTFVRPDSDKKRRHYDCFLKGKANAHPKNVSQEGLTSGYSLRPCSERPEFKPLEVYKNVNFMNADYDFLFTPDREACQRVCTLEPFCQFFTFDKSQSRCDLKNSFTVLEISKIKDKKGVVSGFSHNVKMDPPTLQHVANAPACEEHVLPNTDIPGNDFTKIFATCHQHCLALCSAHPRCSLFSFDSRDNGCYLKHIKESQKVEFKDKHKVTSGFPARFCKMDSCWIKEAKKGLDFTGYELKSELEKDAESCQMKCTANPDCQFYTFVTKGPRGKCSHKRTITMPAPTIVQRQNGLESGFTQKKSFCGTN